MASEKYQVPSAAAGVASSMQPLDVHGVADFQQVQQLRQGGIADASRKGEQLFGRVARSCREFDVQLLFGGPGCILR